MSWSGTRSGVPVGHAGFASGNSKYLIDAPVPRSRTEQPDVFDAARVGLGALGIVTTLTFRVEPRFVISARETPMSWSEVVSRYDELVETHHHVDLYWFPHTEQVIAKTQVKHVVVASMGDLFGMLKGTLVNFVVRNVKKMVDPARAALGWR